MRIPQSRDYIASNPRFALTSAARPRIQRGQMTILYESLEPFPSEYSLEELVSRCIERGYKSTFRNANTDIRKSNLYHLNRFLNGTEHVPPNSGREATRN
jgi:hypothetical protein